MGVKVTTSASKQEQEPILYAKVKTAEGKGRKIVYHTELVGFKMNGANPQAGYDLVQDQGEATAQLYTALPDACVIESPVLALVKY